MKLHPHINFGGQCRAAFNFYQQCLGDEIVTMLSWSDSPMANQVPPAWHDKICHATLTLGENELAGVDDPHQQYESPKGFQLILDVDEPEDAERIFESLSVNAAVKLPLQKTFWAGRYALLTDRFGVPWEINCAKGD